MTSRPPLRRLGLAVAAIAAAACAPGPPSTPTGILVSPSPVIIPSAASSTSSLAAFPGSLLVLVESPDDRVFLAWTGDGRSRPIALSGRGLVRAAAGPDGRLAATTLDRSVVTAADPDGDWQPLIVGPLPDAAETAEVLLPAWSPSGGLAVVHARASTASVVGVALVAPADGSTRWLPLDTGLGDQDPAWLDDRHLVISTRGRGDAPTVTILDVVTGTARAVAGSRAAVAAADGSIVAVLDTDERTIEIRAPDPAGGLDGATVAILDPLPAGLRVDGLALPADGSAVAVATTVSDGAPGSALFVSDPDGRTIWTASIDAAGSAGIGFLP